MKTIKRIAGIIGFILIFLLLLSEASSLLMHKQIEGRWNMTAKVAGFYNEEPNSFDVLFFGSSHMYCSVDPAAFMGNRDLHPMYLPHNSSLYGSPTTIWLTL